MDKKKSTKKEKEPKKATEIFEVEKDGKVNEVQEEIEVKKEEQTPKEKKDQVEHQNNILKGILIVLGVIIIIIVAWQIIAKSVSTFEYENLTFEYENLDFEVIQEGEIIFYRIGLPTMYQGQLTEYSFYLRNDARKLDVPFEGNLDLKEEVVLNLEQDFNCEGRGIIAVANLMKLYQFLGLNIIGDENATCDPEGRYTMIQILEGDETKIEEIGQSCYNVYINDCEILEGTERLMIETLMKVKATTPDYKY